MSLTAVSLAFRAYCLYTSRLHCVLQLYVNTSLHNGHSGTAVLFSPNFVVMFSFQLMYGIFYGIYRLLLLVFR